MLTLELSSYVLEIPNDAMVKIWLAVQHSVKSTAIWLVDIGKYWEVNFEHKHALFRWYLYNSRPTDVTEMRWWHNILWITVTNHVQELVDDIACPC